LFTTKFPNRRIQSIKNAVMGIIDYVGDNAIQIDAVEYEKKVRDQCPRLLGSDERVIYAFKSRGGSGRDKHMFTSTRFLIKDRKGEWWDRIRVSASR